MEGVAVRKNWFTVWAAAGLAVGCAGTNSPGPGGMGMAQNGSGAFGQPQAVQQTSWTQRVLAPFGLGTPAAADAQRDAVTAAKAAEARRQALDPLALGNSAEPNAKLYISMAEMSSAGGNAAQARGLYQKALSMEPKNLDALLGAARMEDREGRMDVAVMLYQRAAAAYPNNPTVLNDLGLCLARQGELAGAERALARAVQLEPAKPLYRNNMAKVQIELNHMDAAMSHLAAVYPPPVVNYNMGVLLYQRGRSAESERFLTAALSADPRMEPARALLAEMHPAAPVYHTARAPQVAKAPVSPTAPQMIVTPAPAIPSAESLPTMLPPVN
jgi:Tfp pilus assembly protein PilF